MSWLYRFLLAVVLSTFGLESAVRTMATLRPPPMKNALQALHGPPLEIVVPPPPPPVPLPGEPPKAIGSSGHGTREADHPHR
jgi:hypothetical protein